MHDSPAFRWLGIGFYLVASLIMPLLLGIWLDNQLNSEPILTLVMLFLGLLLGFFGVYKQVKEVIGSKKK
ncbi:MAG: AtpZ/AtpI family protein [Dehalococcoidia bacterium]